MTNQCRRIIVLAMHGQTPNDFPSDEKLEFFRLHSQLERARTLENSLKRRHDELEVKIRKWPRTKENDPYYSGSQDLARALSSFTGDRVLLGFNEFCEPSLDQAIMQAASFKPEGIIVVTPMMTRGGTHAEKEIPEIVKRAQQLHPNVQISYAWPFDSNEVAKFLASQIPRPIRT